MKKNLLIGLMWFCIFNIQCLAGKYAVTHICDTLTKEAVAVVREDFTQWQISDARGSAAHRNVAITILNARGLSHVDLFFSYNSLSRVSNLKGRIYDGDGNLVRELRHDEFSDRSYRPGFAVYSDTRVVSTDLYYNQYPFTVEYEYSIVYTGRYLNQTWTPVTATEISLEKAGITIEMPGDFTFRYQTGNISHTEPVIQEEPQNRVSHSWKLTALPAVKSEPYMPALRFILPWIAFTPNEFDYGGTTGNLQSWQSFGEWINHLNHDRQRLRNSTLREIRAITEPLTDTLDKITAVYKFVQESTRYVSISLGIGGFQPEPAAEVAANGYGDCKALANYTMALLQAIGIPSHYTLIQNGAPGFLPVRPHFPFNNFNHAILCVPLQQDTLWLETTAQILPAGYIGRGNTGRYVLLATEEGGVLTRTPPFQQDKNIISQNVHIDLCQQGDARLSIRKNFHGLAFEERAGIELASNERQHDLITEESGLRRVNIEHAAYEYLSGAEPAITKHVQMNARNITRRAGNRLIFQPVILNHAADPPSQPEQRVNDFQTPSTYVYTDTLHWKLPEGYNLRHLPENQLLDTSFGYYQLEYEYTPENSSITLMRKYFLKGGLWSKEEYHDFVAFLNQVKQADSASLMLGQEKL